MTGIRTTGKEEGPSGIFSAEALASYSERTGFPVDAPLGPRHLRRGRPFRAQGLAGPSRPVVAISNTAIASSVNLRCSDNHRDSMKMDPHADQVYLDHMLECIARVFE